MNVATRKAVIEALEKDLGLGAIQVVLIGYQDKLITEADATELLKRQASALREYLGKLYEMMGVQ
jgi:hypothetical protein